MGRGLGSEGIAKGRVEVVRYQVIIGLEADGKDDEFSRFRSSCRERFDLLLFHRRELPDGLRSGNRGGL